MKLSWGFFACCCVGLFFSGSQSCRDEGASQSLLVSKREASEQLPASSVPPDAAETGYTRLASVFKGLDCPSHPEGNDGAQIPRPPESRALSFMKRLYGRFATKEGVPKARKNHRFNIVRLFTPHAECKYPTADYLRGDLRSVDLLFNLDYVSTLESLFKSVLLYSLNKPISNSSSITCTCSLVVKEHDSSDQACCSVPHMMQAALRRKRLVVDVTTFLRPLIASNKRHIQIAMNFTCLKDNERLPSKRDLFTLGLVSPSLLLYLNDTSEQDMNSLWCALRSSTFRGPSEDTEKEPMLDERPSHQEGNDDGVAEDSSVPPHSLRDFYQSFLMPSNECQLQNFQLEFSQLRWDQWIIEPYSYNSRYCRGECQIVAGRRYVSPVPTMVQDTVYEKLAYLLPRPSCVPVEFSPLSVLMVEKDGSIVYRQYKNMITNRCACV